MKNTIKNIAAVLLFVASAFTVSAQDTLVGPMLPDKYYAPERPDTATLNSHTEYFVLYYQCQRSGLIKYTDTALTVYGIAASLMTPPEYNPPASVAMDAMLIYDTSRSALHDEHLILWELYGTNDSIVQVKETTVPIGSMAPDYYWNTQFTQPFGSAFPVLPMYESYFDEPVVVEDSFVVGRTNVNGGGYNKPGEIFERENWSVSVPSFWVADIDGENEQRVTNSISWTHQRTFYIIYDTIYHPEIQDSILYLDSVGMDTVESSYWRRDRTYNAGHVFLFPIITPRPDTVRSDTTVTTDTSQTGIGRMTLVDRNTTVSPNPATQTVRVASGFGITAIEVFDAAGAKVHEQKASGMTATLEVGRWARGTYMLRIHTAVGIATKKLVVQ